METFAIKLILVGAFFVTLVCFAIWSQQKLEEYKDYWKKDDHEGR